MKEANQGGKNIEEEIQESHQATTRTPTSQR